MNIFPQNHNTSFQGIYKGTVKINELKNGLKLPKDVSVVELNPRDKHDLKVLDKLSETYKETNALLRKIVEKEDVNEAYIFDVLDKWAQSRKVKIK